LAPIFRYDGDITRTVPAAEMFTRAARIYDIVLGAQNAALAALKARRGNVPQGKQSPLQVSYA